MREGYKYSPLGEIPDSWEVVKLKDIVSQFIVPMRDKPKTFSGDIPWCRIEDFDGIYLSKSRSDRCVSIDTIKAMNLKVYPVGTVLVSCSAYLGRCAITRKPLTTNQTFIGLTPNQSVSALLLYYKMIDSSLKLNQLSTGTTISYLSRELFESFKITFPSNPIEQQKIAEILTTIDDKIEIIQTQIENNQQLKKGLMQRLLTRGIGHTRFKDSALGEIPESWDVVELRENLSFISYGFTNPMPESKYGHFMLTARDVIGGRIAYETVRKTTSEAYNELLTDKSRPKINDILLTKDGTLGRVAVVDKIGICINQSVAVLRPNEKMLPKFLFHLLSSPIYQNEMLDKARGSTIKHIYITVVDKMKVVVPPYPEQKNITKILSGVDEKLDVLQIKKNYFEHLKKGLMQKLLTGKIIVKI